MTQKTIIIKSDDISLAALNAALTRHDLQEVCELIPHDDEGFDITLGSRGKHFDYPVRLGTVLDEILFLRKKADGTPKTIEINDAVLDTHLGVFTPKSREGITLTEKEVEILLYLHQQEGKVVSKEELLDAVWNYAKTVETHTLETHIYRLRQKIEDDPSQPKYLKTEEKGYCL